LNEEAVTHWGLLRQKGLLCLMSGLWAGQNYFIYLRLQKFLFVIQADRVWGEPAFGFIWVCVPLMYYFQGCG
jgi:hypothetical protein